MWLVIIIIVLIYALVLTPIQHGINKIIKNRKLNIVANLILAVFIFLLLYFVADAFDVKLW